MLLGHLTTTYVGKDALRRFNIHLSLPILLLGAVLPDLIDKPLALLINEYPGRAIGHSALFHILACCLFLRLFPSHKKATLTLIGGCFLHLLQDWVDLRVLFWPFMGNWEQSIPLSFWHKLYRFYIQIYFPVAWTFEILSFAYILFPYFYNYFKTARQSAKESF